MATMMAPIWALAMAIRLAGTKEGKGKGGKGNGGEWERDSGDEEDKGGKAFAIAMVTRIAGKWTAMATKRAMVTVRRVAGERCWQQQRGQWQWHWEWQALKRAMVTLTRVMVLAKRVAGKPFDVALVNYRIFFAMIILCAPKWINLIYRCGGCT
jgi:hypothetical protein